VEVEFEEVADECAHRQRQTGDYTDRGAPSFEANPFVTRVRGYNAADDTYFTKGVFEREHPRMVAAWGVQERMLLSDLSTRPSPRVLLPPTGPR
jgi:hypothetical protein